MALVTEIPVAARSLVSADLHQLDDFIGDKHLEPIERRRVAHFNRAASGATIQAEGIGTFS